MGDLARAFAQVLINEMHGRGQPPGRISDPELTGGSDVTMADAARSAGLSAVDKSLRAEPRLMRREDNATAARQTGEAAVDAEMDKVNRESFSGKMKSAKDAKRAGKAGEAAVAKAVEPTPEEQAAATKAWIERMRAARAAKTPPAAVPPSAGPTGGLSPGSDMPMTPPQTPPSQWGPGEAARYASAFGPQFVEQGLGLPMTPPGHPFGPQPVITPEMEGATQPTPEQLHALGLGAVQRGLEE